MTTVRTIALITSIAKAFFFPASGSQGTSQRPQYMHLGEEWQKERKAQVSKNPQLNTAENTELQALFQNEKHIDENLTERNSSCAIARGQSPAGIKKQGFQEQIHKEGEKKLMFLLWCGGVSVCVCVCVYVCRSTMSR